MKNSTGIIDQSKGAYTSLAKTGGKLNLDQLINYYATNPQMPDCIFYKSENVDFKNLNKVILTGVFSYVVVIDPSLALSFNKESLKNINILFLFNSGRFLLTR